jgi:hypothetical protein
MSGNVGLLELYQERVMNHLKRFLFTNVYEMTHLSNSSLVKLM